MGDLNILVLAWFSLLTENNEISASSVFTMVILFLFCKFSLVKANEKVEKKEKEEILVRAGAEYLQYSPYLRNTERECIFVWLFHIKQKYWVKHFISH